MLAGATALTACNLAPKYVRPVGAVPAELPQGGPYPSAATDAPDVTKVGWRDFFLDARLRQVIETGLANNRDLRVAAANVLQARAQYRVQRADLVPSTNVSAGATYTNSAASAGGAGGATSTNFDIYSVNAGFSSFELDLFGRTRNLSRAALERYFASEEAQRSARISLIAEIATAWLTLASDRDQLALSEQTLKTFEQTLELTRAQFRIGVASELEARQAETNYQGARNDIAALRTRIAQDRNALNLLAGASVAAELLPSALGEGQVTLDALPGDLSSRVLLRRPDVVSAEYGLRAANAQIGAARAALFPKITLTGVLGFASGALSSLFEGGSFNYSGSAGAAYSIFNGGAARAGVEQSEAQRDAALAGYEKAIQTAFREVADALARRGTIADELAANQRNTDAALDNYQLADARYRGEIDTFLATLVAQRSLYTAQRGLVQTKLTRATNLVTLYRTLGGDSLIEARADGPQLPAQQIPQQ